jgi:hypothetical protein
MATQLPPTLLPLPGTTLTRLTSLHDNCPHRARRDRDIRTGSAGPESARSPRGGPVAAVAAYLFRTSFRLGSLQALLHQENGQSVKMTPLLDQSQYTFGA